MNTHRVFKFIKACLVPQRLLWVTVSLLLILNCSCSGTGATAANPWPTSTPEKQGMDSAQLKQFLDIVDQQQLNLHSILVLRHGTLVMEAYYPPFTPQDKHMLWSVTKSFLSALVGIAIKEGKIKSVDQPMLDFFPNTSIANMNDDKKNIHIHDLLNMNSGLTSDDIKMGESPNWTQFTLDQPMLIDPGTSFDYNSGNSQVLSAIIQKATGKTALEYAREKLFTPLGIQNVEWEADASGTTKGGVGLRLTPWDMAKFGFLYLNKGLWKGGQIVPAEWVEASTQTNPNGYAYQWWQTENGYAAEGWGGQQIYIIPSKDLVIIITAAVPEDQLTSILMISDMFIVKAAQSDQPLPESPAAKELSDRLAAIANPKPQAVPALPAVAASLKGKTLRLDDNPLGWKTAQLDFEGSQATLTVTTAAAPNGQKFAIGMDEVYRKTDVKAIPTLSVPKPGQRYFLNPYEFSFLLGTPQDGAVAMKGKWSTEDEFYLTVQDMRDFDRDTLVFKFTPPGAKIDWYSYMEGGSKLFSSLMTLKGKLE